MRILLVEDEKKIASFIERGLKEQGYSVDVAFDGEEGFERAHQGEWDILILDVMLPKQNGLEVCKKLRYEKKVMPILILSAKDQVQDRVLGLDSGADDYLVKPFAFEELLARIRALLRKRDGGQTLLTVLDLQMDLVTREVKRAGEIIELSNKEFALLEYLMRNKGRVVTRTMISQHVWNIDFDTMTNVIEVYFTYLRKKIDSNHDVKLIKTLRGRGYTLSEEA